MEFFRFSGEKSLFVAFALLSIILLSGCSKGPGFAGGKNVQQLGGFLGGDRGLALKVIAGAPPEVVQDRGLTPFSFLMTLENVGEAKVGEGTDNPLIIVRLLGIVHKDFGLTPESGAKRIAGPLEPARRNIDGTITPGEITEAIFDNMAYKPAVLDSATLTIRAEACYDYESIATTKFCMKKDFFESSQDSSICVLKGPRAVGNSGAPLHVASVEEAPINENTIQLNFRIEHAGRGVFFYRNTPKDNYDACEFNDLNPNIYKVEVLVEPVQKGTYSTDCIRLDEKIDGGGSKGVIRSPLGAPISITCFVKRETPTEQRVYEDLLNIRLRYRYGEFLEVPVLIQSHP